MINHQGVEFLYHRFSAEPFKVADLGDEELYELMTIIGLSLYSDDQSNRIRLGNSLMDAVNARWTLHVPLLGNYLILAENPSDQDTGETATYRLADQL